MRSDAEKIYTGAINACLPDEAVKEVSLYLEDIDFTENCKLLIERSYKRQFDAALEDRAALMKLVASLERMGYSFSEIKEASEEIASD